MPLWKILVRATARFIGKCLLLLLSLAVGLALVEVFLQRRIHSQQGYWLYKVNLSTYEQLFRKHEWLVAEARPATVYWEGPKSFSHNRQGFRGPELRQPKPAGVKRIVCYGGSSTYCIGVTDNQTWPSYLQQFLGPSYEVLNAGLPGYSTAENIIQTALQQKDINPDIAIYYLGWNDVRNMHVETLRQDYSDFHAHSQEGNLSINDLKVGKKSALVRFIHEQLKSIFLREEGFPVQGYIQSGIDARALDIYRYNLQTLARLCKSRHIQAIFVPHLLNNAILTSDRPYGWAPFIRDRDLPAAMDVYNQTLLGVCREEQAICADSVLKVSWEPKDFFDQGHFSTLGTAKFAQTVLASVSEAAAKATP